jgi:hypothetical protein
MTLVNSVEGRVLCVFRCGNDTQCIAVCKCETSTLFTAVTAAMTAVSCS